MHTQRVVTACRRSCNRRRIIGVLKLFFICYFISDIYSPSGRRSSPLEVKLRRADRRQAASLARSVLCDRGMCCVRMCGTEGPLLFRVCLPSRARASPSSFFFFCFFSISLHMLLSLLAALFGRTGAERGFSLCANSMPPIIFLRCWFPGQD